MSDLELAVSALLAKQKPYDLAWDFYDGKHPLVYSTDRLKEVFSDINARFSENWCAVVIDAMNDRIQLDGFLVAEDEAASARLDELWEATEMNLDDDDAHLASLVTGEAFIIVWKEGDGPVEAYYNDPRLCHIHYDPERPREKLWAAKWWLDADEYRHLTLYYADRLEYYVTSNKAKDLLSLSAKSFQPAEDADAPNPYGQVPVFHLRRERRRIKSELANAIEPQNAINKLLSDMMVAAEFGAFGQRWIITNADVSGLQSRPGGLFELPPAADGEQPVSVGEFPTADLANYINAIERSARSLAIITRTPKHYLFQQGGDPSGEALIAMEAPLNKKCAKYIERASAAMAKVGAFMLSLDTGQPYAPTQVAPQYREPQTVQPLTQSLIYQNLAAAGNPYGAAMVAGYLKEDAEQIAYGEEGAGPARSVPQEVASRAEARAAALLEEGEGEEA